MLQNCIENKMIVVETIVTFLIFHAILSFHISLTLSLSIINGLHGTIVK